MKLEDILERITEVHSNWQNESYFEGYTVADMIEFYEMVEDIQ